MKVYLFSAHFDSNGNNVVRHAYPKRPQDFWERNDEGAQIYFEWGEGDDVLPIGSFIPTTTSAFSGAMDLVVQVRDRFAPQATLQRMVIDGDSVERGFLKPANFGGDDRPRDHLFFDYPRQKGLLVTQKFLDFWRVGGFTGASFKEIGELSDLCFRTCS